MFLFLSSHISKFCKGFSENEAGVKVELQARVDVYHLAASAAYTFLNDPKFFGLAFVPYD